MSSALCFAIISTSGTKAPSLLEKEASFTSGQSAYTVAPMPFTASANMFSSTSLRDISLRRASTSAAVAITILQSATDVISSYILSRVLGVSFLESLTPMAVSGSSVSMKTAPTTRGPMTDPLPASSTPQCMSHQPNQL